VYEINRDFLVAVMALRTDTISRPGLDAAIKSWSRNRERPLAQFLKESAGLDDASVQALECLATFHLKTHDGDLRRSLRALNAEDLTPDFLTEVADADPKTIPYTTLGCEATLPSEAGSSQVPENTFSLHPASDSKEPRFQLIKQHAKGGIGEVWLARDAELQRDVAVKEIQPRYVQSETQRARFVLEAEITGNLEHPGIVPVYSLGINAEGNPYYAMRFIRGESLSVAIKRFHKQSRDDVEASSAKAAAPAVKSGAQTKWGIEFRQLIGRFLDVCDAMDYAHNRGVLHRDLKPANIMLGPYGETLVVDWGLAKVIGQLDVPLADGDGGFDPGSSGPSDTTSQGTVPGTTIGTLAYMSPEQARGLIDKLGPPSDVYSLGASLYELLTGQVAFQPGTIADVVPKVLAGDFPAPRTVDRSIPVPLEAICLKAMAKEQEDRYDSVRALARDLEHWLADEPTAAHPESRLEQMGRWIRQHRALTYTTTAALIAISMVAIIAAFVIDGARRNETVARLQAETNLRMAQKAVDDYLTSVSENTLLKEQDSVDIRSLRRDLLKSALSYYEEFAKDHKNDPSISRQLANAYYRVGLITKEIDSHPKAIDAFRAAQAIWEKLFAAEPKDRELASGLSACYLATGKLQAKDENFPAAMASLEKARTILEQLVAEYGSEVQYQAVLADCYSEIGNLQANVHLPKESLATHDKAKAIQQRLIEQYPNQLAYQQSFAENINKIGYAHALGHDNDAAIKAFQQVREKCEAIMKELPPGPKPVWLLNLLALSQYNIAIIYKQKREIEAALPFFEESLKYRSDLAESHPSVTQFHEKLAVSYREIAELQHVAHDDSKALSSSQKSVDVVIPLVKAHPEQASLHNMLAFNWNYLGLLHDETNRNNAAAIRPFKEAIAEQRLAIEKAEHPEDYKGALCIYLENLGEQYIDLGRPADGVASNLQALRLRRELSSNNVESKAHALQLVTALNTLGTIRRHEGQAGPAREFFEEAKRVVDKWRAKDADDRGLKIQLAVVLDNIANTMADQNQPKLARPLLEQARNLFRQAGTTATGNQVAQDTGLRSDALWDLGRVLRALELTAKADHALQERRDLLKTRTGDELVDLALERLGRATLIGYGKSPVSDQAIAVRKLDLAQAADLVVLALSQGIKNTGKLRSHPDSNLLLERDDLRSLIDGAESANSPTGAQSAIKSRDP
jgi:eukaryotic-like serine/threonine-protein kinase